MATKDFGGYKRIVQYFWDPEPRNDDPHKSPIWCLGRRYESTPTTVNESPASDNTALEKNGDGLPISQEYPREDLPKLDNGQVSGKSTTETPHPSSEEDRGWPTDFLDDFESRLWFTYRSGFPAIRRSDAPKSAASMTFAVRLRSQLVDHGGFSSDTGWGCMIRSGQSLLANALVTLRLGRGATCPPFDPRETLTMFQLGDGACSIVRKGKCLNFLPMIRMPLFQYIDLSTTVPRRAANILVNGSDLLQPQDALTLVETHQGTSLKVYVNGDGADVYEDRFLSLAINSEGGFTPTLILVGIRLGIDRITPVYGEALKASLQLPQSIGIAGGRPSSSHYFIGHQGDHFFFLDPHQTQPALPLQEETQRYGQEDVNSCHTRRLRRLPLQAMDPSMLIGFLIRDKDDWRTWRRSVTEVQGKPVIHVASREPIINGKDVERQSAVDEVEALDDDDDEGDGDGELVEYPNP
ncbi:MAG: hypothetical protein Q9183_001161 [Haloplaca sp. 2 TL-2023]